MILMILGRMRGRDVHGIEVLGVDGEGASAKAS